MPRVLFAASLCLFATAALAAAPVDRCNKIANPARLTVAPSHAAATSAATAVAPTPLVAQVPTPDSNNHHAGTGAASTPHTAQPRIISPRWHSFLPGMFR
jgi:hypothetical protein